MRIDLNNDWLWSPEFVPEMTGPVYSNEDKMEQVRIPHTVKVTPLNYFDDKDYQMVSCYRRTFDAPSDWKGKKVSVTFDAPLFGIWSPAGKNAPFVCIEPWYGRADKTDFSGTIADRDYDNALPAGESFEAEYTIEYL